MKKLILAPALAASALGMSACAENYAVEGGLAGAAAGAGAAALLGGDIETYALAGAAIGGVVGYAVDKDDDCDGYYGDGRYVDDDCRYTDGYQRYW
ncbi:glycine zipper domain-containing protein [Aurantiacibacter poecillastricola]|uniref:glycine zipper domain-containing protein n=1 Tax=Aurantiacibacter poecillastricola TaxID=3064385 RepID=UPI00273F2EDA|nr:glycine zipper domain-containing protein [Aurantiacibacter sp. 219JJ12-13]MDP5262020.1 glycine zipper domain-containing protein [Aurantiacibacter sp. 219JJ12-13]